MLLIRLATRTKTRGWVGIVLAAFRAPHPARLPSSSFGSPDWSCSAVSWVFAATLAPRLSICGSYANTCHRRPSVLSLLGQYHCPISRYVYDTLQCDLPLIYAVRCGCDGTWLAYAPPADPGCRPWERELMPAPRSRRRRARYGSLGEPDAVVSVLTPSTVQRILEWRLPRR